MKRTIQGLAVALTLAMTLGALVACRNQAAPGATAELPPRIDALEKKVGNVEGTAFNGADVSILGVIPKFAVTMREYGARFNDMYFAAKNGNWALAAYMDHYMRGALNPTKVTKPKEQGAVSAFHKDYLDPLLTTIADKDWVRFQAQYASTIIGCNNCHTGFGYGFIVVTTPEKPSSIGLSFAKRTNPTDFKEFAPPPK